MNIKPLLKSLVSALLLAALPVSIAGKVQAQEQTTINWFYPDWRPGFLEYYTDQGEIGFADRILHHLEQELPEFDHRRLKLNWARWERMIETRRDVCFSSGFYRWPDEQGNPRSDVVWSAPYLVFSYHGLVIRKADAEKYGTPPISLAELLNNGSLKMLVEKDRTYSAPVNDILTAHSDSATIIERPTSGDVTGGVMRMLATNRADFALEYPLSFEYNATQENVRASLTILPVMEHQDLFGWVSTVCSDTPLGRTVIDTINARRDRIRNAPVMRDIAEECCIIPGTEDRYWQEVEKMMSRSE